MRYRKKPVEVDAEQWFPGKQIEGVREVPVPLGLQTRMPDGQWETRNGIVITPEGKMAVRPGDWIITGVKGEKYPCKPDIFALTHEPVEE